MRYPAIVPPPVTSIAAPPRCANPTPRSRPTASCADGITSGSAGLFRSATKSSFSRAIASRSSGVFGTSKACQPNGPPMSPRPAAAGAGVDAGADAERREGAGAGSGMRNARPRSSRTRLRPASRAIASRGRSTASCITWTGLASARLSSGPSRRVEPLAVCHSTPLTSRIATASLCAETARLRSGASRCTSAIGIPSAPTRSDITTSRRPTMATVHSDSAAPTLLMNSERRSPATAARMARNQSRAAAGMSRTMSRARWKPM